MPWRRHGGEASLAEVVPLWGVLGAVRRPWSRSATLGVRRGRGCCALAALASVWREARGGDPLLPCPPRRRPSLRCTLGEWRLPTPTAGEGWDKLLLCSCPKAAAGPKPQSTAVFIVLALQVSSSESDPPLECSRARCGPPSCSFACLAASWRTSLTAAVVDGAGPSGWHGSGTTLALASSGLRGPSRARGIGPAPLPGRTCHQFTDMQSPSPLLLMCTHTFLITVLGRHAQVQPAEERHDE